MELTKLSTLLPGQRGTIKEVKGTGLFFLRLRSLGVRPDTDVAVIRKAPFGGSLHIRLGERENLAVPQQEAAHILLALNA